MNQFTKNNNSHYQTVTNYIQVDSKKRSKRSINIYEEPLYSLPPYAFQFKNGSCLISVDLPNHPFKINDNIIFSNVTSKNIILRDVVMVKKNSLFIRIFHKNHGLSLYGLYDSTNMNDFIQINYVDHLPNYYNENDDIPDNLNQYYILKNNFKLNYSIQISNVKGSDFTKSLIGNIPTNYLNQRQTIFFLFYQK